uniref:Putative secreted protein n=1 Tax=Anopheles triannulatus TaxID=58253 RepID=A0A2M4B3U8_9DIPT
MPPPLLLLYRSPPLVAAVVPPPQYANVADGPAHPVPSAIAADAPVVVVIEQPFCEDDPVTAVLLLLLAQAVPAPSPASSSMSSVALFS